MRLKEETCAALCAMVCCSCCAWANTSFGWSLAAAAAATIGGLI